MKKEIKFYQLWSTGEVLTTIITLALILLVFGLWLFYPQISEKYRSSKFDSECLGVITNIEEQKMIHQTKFGNENKVMKYIVRYEYSVNNRSFAKTDKISNKGINRHILYDALKSKKNVKVLYRSDEPKKSMLSL